MDLILMAAPVPLQLVCPGGNTSSLAKVDGDCHERDGAPSYAPGGLRLALVLLVAEGHMFWMYSWFWGFDSWVPDQSDSQVPHGFFPQTKCQLGAPAGPPKRVRETWTYTQLCCVHQEQRQTVSEGQQATLFSLPEASHCGLY
jgi:hypothetical protein